MISFRMGERQSQRLARFCTWIRLAIAVALLLSLHARAQSSAPDTSETTVIRGTVINSVTQAPIPRALVYSADNRYATLTDGDGHFEFSVPKETAGVVMGFASFGLVANSGSMSGNSLPFPLMARKPGFLDPPDQIGNLTSSGGDIRISLLPEGIIKGRVTGTGDEPAAGILVQLFQKEVQQGISRWLPGPTTQANSAGEFRFAELLPGSYKIASREWMDNDPAAFVPGAKVYGFPPVYYPGTANAAGAGMIELTAGQTVEADLPIVHEPYYNVRIPLSNGGSNTGFSVSVQGQNGARYELGYNPGEQRIEGMLPSGNYVIQVASYGPNSASGTISMRVADAPVDGPALTLIPNPAIPVTVKEEFADAKWVTVNTALGRRASRLGSRAYLQVNAESADEWEQRIGSVRPPAGPDDSTLVLESLPPGRYWLRLSTSRGYVASASMGPTDLLREPFTIAPGSSTPIEITLRDDGAELEGSINSSAEQNNSMPSSPMRAWVICVPMPDSSGQFQELAVSPDGTFHGQMMVPGDYRILGFDRPQPRLAYRDVEAMKRYDGSGEVVHLNAGQKTTVQLRLISE
jgi:hypothetical protein